LCQHLAVTTRRRLPPEQRRAELLDHTAQVLVEQGSDALTIEAVAKRAGVNRALLYYYFDSRDNLLVELFDRTAERFDAALDAHLALAETPRDRVVAIVEAWVEDLDQRAAIMGALQSARTESGELEMRKLQRVRASADKFADLLGTDHGLECDEAMIAAAALIGASQGLAVLRRFQGIPTERISAVFAGLAVGGLEQVADHATTTASS
jgi:AcrR family transcriptional regulator